MVKKQDKWALYLSITESVVGLIVVGVLGYLSWMYLDTGGTNVYGIWMSKIILGVIIFLGFLIPIIETRLFFDVISKWIKRLKLTKRGSQ